MFSSTFHTHSVEYLSHSHHTMPSEVIFKAIQDYVNIPVTWDDYIGVVSKGTIGVDFLLRHPDRDGFEIRDVVFDNNCKIQCGTVLYHLDLERRQKSEFLKNLLLATLPTIAGRINRPQVNLILQAVQLLEETRLMTAANTLRLFFSEIDREMLLFIPDEILQVCVEWSEMFN